VGLPRVEPKEYWEQVPAATRDIYRHLPFQHLGVEGIGEMTVVKMHNRRVLVELDGLLKDCKDSKQVQMTVFNYVAVLRSLHPIDYSGLVILRVLMEAAWAENLGNEKQKVAVMKKFFEEVVRENSGRAVRKEGNSVYAHVCNYLFRANGNQAERHCLAAHSRVGNHWVAVAT
jgi:hypothetical protein